MLGQQGHMTVAEVEHAIEKLRRSPGDTARFHLERAREFVFRSRGFSETLHEPFPKDPFVGEATFFIKP